MHEGSFEEQYFDVLHAIESCIYHIYSGNKELLDYSVDKVLNGLIRSYSSLQKGRNAPPLRFSPDEQSMFDEIQKVMSIYLSSDAIQTLDEEDQELEVDTITIDELIACFRRIQRSIKLMSDQGRQGYLNFIKGFFGG